MTRLYKLVNNNNNNNNVANNAIYFRHIVGS